MVGLSTLLLTLLSAAPASFSSLESMDQQQCALVEAASPTVPPAVTALFEPATAVLPTAPLSPLPSTALAPTDEAPCSYEPSWTAAPAVIDCNDVRTSIWVPGRRP